MSDDVGNDHKPAKEEEAAPKPALLWADMSDGDDEEDYGESKSPTAANFRPSVPVNDGYSNADVRSAAGRGWRQPRDRGVNRGASNQRQGQRSYPRMGNERRNSRCFNNGPSAVGNYGSFNKRQTPNRTQRMDFSTPLNICHQSATTGSNQTSSANSRPFVKMHREETPKTIDLGPPYKLHFTGLPRDVTVAQVRDMLEPITLKGVEIPKRQDGPKVHAFVEVYTYEDMNAVLNMPPKRIGDCHVNVKLARKQFESNFSNVTKSVGQEEKGGGTPSRTEMQAKGHKKALLCMLASDTKATRDTRIFGTGRPREEKLFEEQQTEDVLESAKAPDGSGGGAWSASLQGETAANDKECQSSSTLQVDSDDTLVNPTKAAKQFQETHQSARVFTSNGLPSSAAALSRSTDQSYQVPMQSGEMMYNAMPESFIAPPPQALLETYPTYRFGQPEQRFIAPLMHPSSQQVAYWSDEFHAPPMPPRPDHVIPWRAPESASMRHPVLHPSSVMMGHPTSYEMVRVMASPSAQPALRASSLSVPMTNGREYFESMAAPPPDDVVTLPQPLSHATARVQTPGYTPSTPCHTKPGLGNRIPHVRPAPPPPPSVVSSSSLPNTLLHSVQGPGPASTSDLVVASKPSYASVVQERCGRSNNSIHIQSAETVPLGAQVFPTSITSRTGARGRARGGGGSRALRQQQQQDSSRLWTKQAPPVSVNVTSDVEPRKIGHSDSCSTDDFLEFAKGKKGLK